MDKNTAWDKEGLVSERKRAVLRKHRLWYLAGSAAFIGLLGLLAVGIAEKIAHPSFGARGPFWLLSALAVCWLVLLSRACRQYGRVRRDLAEGDTESVTGPVSHHLSSIPGIIPLLRYQIQCGEGRFSVPQHVFFQLQGGRAYRICYARHSRIFLDAVPCDAASAASNGRAPVADRTSDVAPPLPELPQAGVDPLHEREQEVLELIAAGLSNQEIADRLYLSIPTVKMYASQLYRKLNVRRRTEAVRRARQVGLLPPL